MTKSLLPALVVASMMNPIPALAQTPGTIADLVGARAPGGETQLETRGWTHIKTEQGDDRAWSYWWQPQRRECVSVAVREGRFDSITSTPSPDCNQPLKSRDSGAGAAAAVAIAAIGIAALAHSSHHHDDGKHLDTSDDQQFERGYRDGLYNQPYHNFDRSDAYSGGYERGNRQRDRETDYRGSSGDGAGYAPSVSLNDLVTARAAGADAEIQRRGFRTVTAYQAGTTSYTIRSNERTGQCVQVATTDGRIRYIAALNQKSCRR